MLRMGSLALLPCPPADVPRARRPLPDSCALGLPLDAAACAAVTALALPETLPASPDNPVADDEAAAQMGHQLFFDARFSANKDVRCASCHAPESIFDDGQPTSTGGLA